jgi:hypothetical protein
MVGHLMSNELEILYIYTEIEGEGGGHYATGRTVAGSLPDGVTVFFQLA